MAPAAVFALLMNDIERGNHMSLINDGYVYSYSRLTSFAECPYSFFLKQIERLPQKTNGFAEQGSLIHDLIDKWAKGELQKEDLPNEYVRRYPDEVVTQFPNNMVSRGYAEKTYEAGLRYFEKFDEFKGLQIIGTEIKFKTVLCGRPFVGTIDMVARDKKTGKLLIVDHKSKSYLSFTKSGSIMWRQQLLYALYIKETYGIYPDMLMFNLFKENGMRISKPFIMAEYEDAIKWAEEIMTQIESYEMYDWLAHKERPDFFCQNLCNMREHCLLGQSNQRTKNSLFKVETKLN